MRFLPLSILALGLTLLPVATWSQTNTTSAGFFDAGSSAPAVGANDIAQLTFAAGGPAGLNYYVDNSVPPGQIFTTGNIPLVSGGYPLTSLYVKEQSGTSGGGMPQLSAYTLRIYRVAGSSATLVTAYVSTNSMAFAEGDWMVWSGLTNILQTNTTYAFSLHRNGSGWWKVDNNSNAPYAGGQAVLIPTTGGNITFSTNSGYDAAFDVKFDNSAILLLSQPAGVNLSTGAPFSLSVNASGQGPLGYRWRRNGAPIANATNTTYAVASAQPSDSGSYDVVVSNTLNSVISMPAQVSVLLFQTNLSGMLCELLEHPEETVISASRPKFGWSYRPSFRNDAQSRYRIIVASSQSLANAGAGDMWDSGLVSGANSLNVPYAGATLQPNTNYFWRVQTMNSLGQLGAFYGIQQFNTAAQLSTSLASAGVYYQQPSAGSANCYPLRYVSVAAVLVTNTGPGHWFVDFGNDAFGYATVSLNGDFSGTNISYGLGEVASGYTINTNPGATLRYRAGSVTLQSGNVIYPLRSTNAVTGISPPTGTYGIITPFRYLEVTNCPGALTTSNVTQQRLQTEFDDSAATFSSSSTVLNQVWDLCKYSMKALSFDGIYVDGDRERTPYEADTYIHMLSSYGVVNDFAMPRCSFEYLTNHLTWPTEWPMHLVFVAWADYLQTGDPYLMTKYYSFLTNKCLLAGRGDPTTGLVQSYPVSGNTASGDIIDWYRISGDGIGNTDGYLPEGTNAVINAFYYRCMTLMTQIAQLTGNTADATDFAKRASQIYSNYDTAFWNVSSQSYIDGVGTSHSSSDANFFPLVFGLVPANKQAAVVNYIHLRIAANGAMPAGVYGAQYMLEGLFLAGDADTALGLMTTNNTRSWMNMINIGSTITAEAWSIADKTNEDWNHAWGSAPGNLIPRYVLGLRPLNAGYGQVLIQPQLGQTLSYVQGTIPTIRGSVFIQASNAPSQFQVFVDIPGNVTATVMLPATSTNAILDGAVISGSLSNNWLTVTNIGSGQHAISTSATDAPSQTTLYNNWASSWFGTNAANPAIAGQQADPDVDGMSNYAEFIAGTDPTDSQSIFTIKATVSGSVPGSVLVTLAGHNGRTYGLQRSLSLESPSWSSVLTSGPLGSDQTLILSDPQPPTVMAFYKVIVSLP
jgi:hypothetical protein